MLDSLLSALRQQDREKLERICFESKREDDDEDDDDVSDEGVLCGKADPNQVFLVDRNNPNNPNAEYRKKFNQLPPLVCPKPDEDREARAAVDRVVRVLQGQLPKPTRVDRVHKGGSFGRRTSVRDRYDVDLPVFVNGLDYQDKDQVDKLLMHVEEALKAEGVADDGHIEKKPDRCMVHLWSKGWWMDVLLLRNEAEGVGPGMAGIGAMCSGKSWLDRCSRCPRRRFARWRVSRWTEPASAEWRRP